MINPQNMTPEELRALADTMEISRPTPKQAAGDRYQTVTVDGITITVDMRLLEDIRTVRLIAEAQKGDTNAAFQAIELFDRILGDQRKSVEEALADSDGFIKAEDYMEFCGRVFEAVGGKN